MKVFSQFTLSILMVMLVTACGNDNKSGKKNGGSYYDELRARNSHCATSYRCSISELQGIEASYGGARLETVIRQNFCIVGGNQRMQVSQPIQLGFVVQKNDIYVGVTSYGDVGVVIGNGTPQATFTAFLCPRTGQPVSGVQGVSIGVATRCRFKTLYAANMAFSDGTGALFRFLDGGTSRGTPFSICY